MVWGWDKAPHNWLKLLGMLNRFKLTTSLQSSMSSTVLSSWMQASRSGLLELSSSCPLNWSVIRGNKTSLQSKSTRENERCGWHTAFSVSRWEKNDMLTWTAVKSYCTWLFEQVTLNNFHQTAQLLPHHLKIWDAFNELRQLNTVRERKVFHKNAKWKL